MTLRSVTEALCAVAQDLKTEGLLREVYPTLPGSLTVPALVALPATGGRSLGTVTGDSRPARHRVRFWLFWASVQQEVGPAMADAGDVADELAQRWLAAWAANPPDPRFAPIRRIGNPGDGDALITYDLSIRPSIGTAEYWGGEIVVPVQEETRNVS